MAVQKACFHELSPLDGKRTLKAAQPPSRALSSGLTCDHRRTLSYPPSQQILILPPYAWVHRWRIDHGCGLGYPGKVAPCSVLAVLNPFTGVQASLVLHAPQHWTVGPNSLCTLSFSLHPCVFNSDGLSCLVCSPIFYLVCVGTFLSSSQAQPKGSYQDSGDKGKGRRIRI